MKSIIQVITVSFCLTLSIISFQSCKVGAFSESKGKPQEAYLQVVQLQTSYPNGVVVTIDNNNSFIAKVNKLKTMGVKGNLYIIPTGRHQLKIQDGDRILVNKEIFVSSQETKQISLP